MDDKSKVIKVIKLNKNLNKEKEKVRNRTLFLKKK
jgi:hypothetical protein